jgi:hypothetical protein
MSYKLRIGFERKKNLFHDEFTNIQLFGSTRTGRRNFQRYVCLAVRVVNRTGDMHLEDPSPKLDNTSHDADGTMIFSKRMCFVQILHIQHTTHKLLFYEASDKPKNVRKPPSSVDLRVVMYKMHLTFPKQTSFIEFLQASK